MNDSYLAQGSKYVLQSWNPNTNKYVTLTTFPIWNEERANIQYNKSYNKNHACRLLKVEITVISKRPGDARFNRNRVQKWNKHK